VTHTLRYEGTTQTRQSAAHPPAEADDCDMSLIKRSSPDELAAKQAARDTWAAGRVERDAARAAEIARSNDGIAVERDQLFAPRRKTVVQSFEESPTGQARIAYEGGDSIFQFSLDVMSQQPIIIAMVGSATTQKTRNPSEVLNAVQNEGWDLVNGSFVFVHEGQLTRDKLMSSGQNVATKGTTVGYYLFKRGTPASDTGGDS
jgi:hypothetical protein